MDIGSQTLCLETKDLAKSSSFYRALGVDFFIDEPGYAVFDTGTTTAALMPWLDENCLNFRGGNVAAIRDHMNAEGFGITDEINRYKDSPGGPGECFLTRDPDGNVLFFDTNESDSPKFRAQRLLKKIELELESLGVQSEHFEAFKDEIESWAGV